MSEREEDEQLKIYLRGGTAVSRAYRAGAEGEPPVRLDRAIRAAARRAVGSGPRAAFGPFGRHWAVPAAAAAVLVLAVGLVTFMAHEGVPVSPGESTRELPAQTADTREAARPQAPGAGPAPPARRVEPSDTRPAPMEQRDMAAPQARERSEAASATEPRPARRATDEIAIPQARKSIRETVAAPSHPAREAAGAAAAPASKGATDLADVLSVAASGAPGAYQLSVTVRSPDTGCQQYADWWEVLSEDGRLLYRRVLSHSHVADQPFTRSGGPVPIGPDTVVWVRAHMHPSGYGGQALRGTVRQGFRPARLAAGIGAQLAQQPPLPGGCEF